MKIHTTDAGVDGLLLSSGTFVPIWMFNVTLNVQDLSVSTKKVSAKIDNANLSSLSPEDRLEFYDYMLCRWLAAKEAALRDRWSSVAAHG